MSEHLTVKNTNERIQYIDALRGFTMILVVFAHVETFGFFNFEYETFVGRLFQSFRMPLFFFISGYISYKKDEKFSINTTLRLAARKIRVQITPTLIFGLAYTYLVLRSTWDAFLYQPQKYGYWFTVSLLEMYLICYFVRTISYYYEKILKTTKDLCSVLLLIIASIMFLTKSYFAEGMPLERIGALACLNETFRYFHFFVIGLLASKYNKLFIRVINNRIVITIFVILFVLFMSLQYEAGQSRVLNTLFEVVPRYSSLFLVFLFFYKYQNTFLNTNILGMSLQYVGKRTLDIYMLHYFCLPYLPSFGNFLKLYPNFVIELFVGILLAMMIVGVCLIISSVLRLSPILSFILFGVRIKKM